MRTITRTEITVKSTEVVVVSRRGSVFQSWCGHCGEEAGMVRLEEAALGPGVEAIRQQVAAGRIHLIELADGLNFICLNSLLK